MELYKKMSNAKADAYIEEIIGQIRSSLKAKAREYVRNNDRMHNFNEAGRIQNTIRENALDGMRIKHIISINDIRKDIEQDKMPSKKILDEKFGDVINYYILEKMSIMDKINY